MSSFKRIEAVDGLRGLSILLVILCHLDVPYFEGGFVGVDVFFVISGFVITGSLYDRFADPGLIRDFYERRARRLLPSLLVTLALTYGAFCLVYDQPDRLRLAEVTGWAALGLSNIFFSQKGGYFDDTSLENPLLHTWSLAVEEQFYLLLSLLLLVLRAFGTPVLARIKQALFVCIGVGTVLSLGLAIYIARADSRFGYFMLPTRFWEIGLGSLLLLLSRKSPFTVHPLLSLLGGILIIIAAVTYDSATPYPGYYALLPTVGALFVIAGSQDSQALAIKILSGRIMVFLGKVSYALYLVHWPMIVFAQYYYVRELTSVEKAVIALLSLLLSAALTFFLEKPILKRKLLPTRQAIWLSGATGICLALIGAKVAYSTPQPVPQQEQFHVGSFSAADVKRMVPSAMKDSQSYVDPLRTPLIGTNPESVTAVWGDSHALCLLQNFATHAHEFGLSYKFFITWTNMPVVGLGSDGEIERHDEELCDLLAKDPNVKNVLMVANWTGYLEGEKYSGHRSGDEPVFCFNGNPVQRRDAYAILKAQLSQTLAKLTFAGKNVFICTPTPAYSFDVPKGIEEIRKQGKDPNVELSISMDQYLAINQRLLTTFSELASEFPHTYVIPVHLELFADGRSMVEKNGQPLYDDGHHLSLSGSDLIGDRIEAFIEKTGP